MVLIGSSSTSRRIRLDLASQRGDAPLVYVFDRTSVLCLSRWSRHVQYFSNRCLGIGC